MAENKNSDKNSGETAAAWEVVSVTESMHAVAADPLTDPLDEAKDKEPPSDAMFMSGHFSLSQKTTELESLLMGSYSKSATVQDESYHHQSMDSSAVSDKTKDELEVDFIEPALYEATRDGGDNSGCNLEKGIEEREETGCNEEKAIEESKEGGEEESWWMKKWGIMCQKVSEEKMLCVFVAATAALVGVAILSHRWQREKLQFSLNEERTNSTVTGPLSRIKVLLTNNPRRPLTHTESSSL